VQATITNAFATGSVTGAAGVGGITTLGGLVGSNQGEGQIATSSSRGDVGSLNIANLQAGGLAGNNAGTIQSSVALGNVQTGAGSTAGGFVASNSVGAPNCAGCPNETALITGSSSRGNVSAIAGGSVTGVGTRDFIGGFVGANFGSIDASAGTGNAIGGTDSAVGAFAGANATFVNFPSESVPGSSFPVGTITNSFATGAATGGAGSTVDPFIALVDPTTAANSPAFPSTIAGCADPTCVFVVTGLLPSSATSPLTPLIPPLQPTTPSATFGPLNSPPLLFISPDLLTSLAAQQAQVILNLTTNVQLAVLSTPPVVRNDLPGRRSRPPR
jgi:hypothetical protein